MSNTDRAGILFVLSAPSGAGKTTLLESLRQTERFHYSVSCTTRSPRPGETDLVDYRFLSREDFIGRRERGDFLETAEVHGHLYGTLRSAVLEQLASGADVLMDVDTEGAAQVRNATDPFILSALVDVFLMPPGTEALRKRLEVRGTESAAEIETRIRNAAREMEHWNLYRYAIPSGSPAEDLEAFRAIMRAERLRTARRLSPPSNQQPAANP